MLEQQYDNEGSLQRRLADFRKALSKNQILEEFDRGIFEVSSKKLLSVVTMKMERKIPIKSFSYIKQDSKMKLETQKNDLGRNQKQ